MVDPDQRERDALLLQIPSVQTTVEVSLGFRSLLIHALWPKLLQLTETQRHLAAHTITDRRDA